MSITTLFFSCAPTHRVVHMHTMPDLNPVEQHVLVHLTCPDSPQRCPGPDLRGDPVPCLIRSVPHVVRRPYRHIRSILLHQFITLVFGVSLNLAYCSFFPHLYQMWHPFVINTLSTEQHQDLHQWGVHGGSWGPELESTTWPVLHACTTHVCVASLWVNQRPPSTCIWWGWVNWWF